MTTTYCDDKDVEFLKAFAAAQIGSRSGSLSEQATLLRFESGTRGFHRRYEHISGRLKHLRDSLKLQVQKHLQTLPGLILAVFDDTSVRKSGRCFEEQAKYFDHVKGTFYEGYNVCSTALYRNGKVGVVDLEISSKNETKIALLQASVEALCREQCAPDVFLFDAWYALKPVLETIEMHNKAYVTRLKSNRLVLFEDERVSLRELGRSINHEEYLHIVVHGSRIGLSTLSST